MHIICLKIKKYWITKIMSRTIRFDMLRQCLRYYRNVWIVQIKDRYLRINILLWLILVVGNLLDLLVTYYAFSQGAIEANPFMFFICTKYGNLALAFYKGLLLGVLLFLLPFIKNIFQKGLIFSCSVYILLVISHIIRF